jgi:bifunctional non-homologous end joining protein LigD
VALDDYRAKRRLSETPEPGARVGASAHGDLFVIHKHAARRLHYDVRLELDGVLKSWAVPKGPSLDPSDKHLAVHVEDHPLDYADFEGVIPKGQYGGGTVMVWDRGRWFPEEATADDPRAAYEAGRLKFRLEGEKLHGRWMLVRMKPRHDPDGRSSDEKADNWLFFKERDDQARDGADAAVTALLPDSAKTGRSVEQIAAAADSVWHSAGPPDADADGGKVARRAREPRRGGAGGSARRAGGARAEGRPDPAAIPGARPAPLPGRVEPQLATLASEAPRGDGWLHEIKFDGYRVVCRLDDGVPRLFTRRGADWTDHFPTLLEPLGRLPAASALLDGEVVYVHDDGRTTFTALASALQGGTDPHGRIVYYVFDLLYLDGYDLTRAPLLARKKALEGLLAGQPSGARVRYVDHVLGHGDEFARQACGYALEGAIAKRAEAGYRAGRGRDWLKVKCLRRQEFLITGFTERTGASGRIGALLVGFHEEPDGPVRCAGRVGTGWDDRTMRDLRARLDPLVVAEPPCENAPRGRAAAGVRWVEPRLVAEIEFFDWNGRDALRHASFEGLRLDKPAGEVVFEEAAGRDKASVAKAAASDEAPVAERPPVKAVGGGAGSGGAARRGEAAVVVGGVAISHPGRVVYPDIGLTKLEVARYYEEMADRMLPYIARRPLTLVRCPGGAAAQCFFQKHLAAHVPDGVLEVPVRESGATAVYPAVESPAGVLALVQMGALELHVWGSHIETLEQPDQMVFDLDPDDGLPFGHTIAAAQTLRVLLDHLGLRSFVKTSGGKGLHVVVPLRPTRSWDEVKDFSHAIADLMVRAEPQRYLATMSRRKRAGKVFIDYLRNGRGATFVAPYSTRRRSGAPVSAPLRWERLASAGGPAAYTIGNSGRRLAGSKTDPWSGYFQIDQEITDDMTRAVGLDPRRETSAA